jgi:hypothetical protein
LKIFFFFFIKIGKGEIFFNVENKEGWGESITHFCILSKLNMLKILVFNTALVDDGKNKTEVTDCVSIKNASNCEVDAF